MPTRDDVARLAGVSGATVSRVFNHPDKLREATCERVLTAAKALNYHPNYYGSVLRGKATKQLYAFCPELANPFFLHMYFGMEQYALEHNYQIFLTRTFNREMIHQGRYDGFLFLVYNTDDVINDIHFLSDKHLPFVISDFQNMVRKDFPTVSVDVEAVGFNAAKHLFELGHDNIVFAASQIDPKWIGVQKCCDQFNKHASLQFLQNGKGIRNYFDIGARCATSIVKMKKIPTAIIAANDEIAVGLINELTRLGFKVPNDISVIGFDDTYIAANCNPSLTTIHYPKSRIGREMARMLIAMLNGDSTQKNIILQTEFVQRESTSQHGCSYYTKQDK